MVNESHYARIPLFKAWRLPASASLCACLGLFHCLLGGAHSLAECDSFSTLHVQMPFSLCENVLCILIWVIASYISFLKSVELYLSKERSIFARIILDFMTVLLLNGYPTAGLFWLNLVVLQLNLHFNIKIQVWRRESDWKQGLVYFPIC